MSPQPASKGMLFGWLSLTGCLTPPSPTPAPPQAGRGRRGCTGCAWRSGHIFRPVCLGSRTKLCATALSPIPDARAGVVGEDTQRMTGREKDAVSLAGRAASVTLLPVKYKGLQAATLPPLRL